MFNYYLHTAFLNNASLTEIQGSLKDLNEIVFGDAKEVYDQFYKENDLKTLSYYDGTPMIQILFNELPDTTFRFSVLPLLLKRLLSVDPVTESHSSLEASQNPAKKCAYWGASFNAKEYYHLSSVNDYRSYKEYVENNVSMDDFWMLRKFLFKKIVLCDQVEKQVGSIKNMPDFIGVVNNLKGLDKYAQSWVNGGFNMAELNRYVEASYESEPTMKDKKCRNKRMMMINKVLGKQSCEPHVKVDNKLRFHFYPHDASKTIYVAYIGKHLPTIDFKH